MKWPHVIHSISTSLEKNSIGFTPKRSAKDFRVESLLVLADFGRVGHGVVRRWRDIDVDVGFPARRDSSDGQRRPFGASRSAGATTTTGPEAERQKRTLLLLEMKWGGFIQRLTVLLFQKGQSSNAGVKVFW